MATAIPTGTIDQHAFDMFRTCAAAKFSTLYGENPPIFRSSTQNLKIMLENPNKYGLANNVGEAIATGAGGYALATLGGGAIFAGPVGLAGLILGGLGASPRLATILVVNGLDQDIELDGSPTVINGIETAYPAVQYVDPISGDTLDGPKNMIPGHKKDLEGNSRYGLGIWRFEKSKLSIGGWTMPFALVGVQGALMFRTTDKSKSGFGVAFEVPQSGDDQVYLTADGSAWKSIESFAHETVDDGKSATIAKDPGVFLIGSIAPRNYPEDNSDTDVVYTIAILPA